MISVIIPVYQTDINKLKKCLDSMVSQTMKELEILLVFDGENQKQFEFCNTHYSNNNFRLIKIERSGVSFVRNVGISKATGDYIMFCDSDDWFENDICEKVWNAIQEWNADMVMWDYICNCENQAIENRLYSGNKVFDNNEKEMLYFGNVCRTLDKQLNGHLMFGSGGIWNKAYRRSMLLNHKIEFPTDCSISEDIIFNLYAIRYAEKIGYLSCLGYHYRIESNSTSFSYDTELFNKNAIYFSYIDKFTKEIKDIELRMIFEQLKSNIVVNTYIRSAEQLRNSTRNNVKTRLKANGLCYEKFKSKFYRNAIKNAKYKYATRNQKICLFMLKMKLFCFFLTILDIKQIVRSRRR